MKKIVFLFMLISLPLGALTPREYFSSLIGEGTYDALVMGKEVKNTFLSPAVLSLLPALEQAGEIREAVKAQDPVMGVEMLFLYRGKKDYTTSDELLRLYNTIHRISTLEGIEYYSVSRKKMRIFFHSASTVDSVKKKNPLPDKVGTEILEKDELLAYVKDSSFGKYVCQVAYSFQKNVFTMDLTNATGISYKLIPAAGPGDLKIFLALIPFEDQILVYGLTCVKAVNFFGLMEKKVDSFYNRIIAMYNWFKGEWEKNG